MVRRIFWNNYRCQREQKNGVWATKLRGSLRRMSKGKKGVDRLPALTMYMRGCTCVFLGRFHTPPFTAVANLSAWNTPQRNIRYSSSSASGLDSNAACHWGLLSSQNVPSHRNPFPVPSHHNVTHSFLNQSLSSALTTLNTTMYFLVISSYHLSPPHVNSKTAEDFCLSVQAK